MASLENAFALLGLPPSAHLMPETVRTAFTAAAAACHPDKNTGEDDRTARTLQFTALNDACAILSHPAQRLRQLYSLLYPEAPAVPPGSGPDDGMIQLFTAAGAAVNAVNAVKTSLHKASTTLARALLAPARMQAHEGLEAVAAALDARQRSMTVALQEIDAALAAGQDSGQEIARAAALAAFLHKWHQQVRTAMAELAALE